MYTRKPRGYFLCILQFCFRHEILCTNQAMLKSSQPINNLNEKTVYIHCDVQSIENVGENVVIEYTHLSAGSSIGEGSIISNNNFPGGVQVPNSSFLHTVVIKADEKDKPLFVTIAFGTEDNLKKSCSSRSDASILKYAGLAFNEALEKLNLTKVLLTAMFQIVAKFYLFVLNET